MKIINWTSDETNQVFAEIKRLKDDGISRTQPKLLNEAQKILPAKRQRPHFNSGNASLFLAKYRLWLAKGDLGNPPAAASAPAMNYITIPKWVEAPPVAKAINFCPGCGISLKELRAFKTSLLNFCFSCGFNLKPLTQ